MAVNRYCSSCKRTYKATKRKCQACQVDLTKYRVRVFNLDGKQVSKVTTSLAEARKLEVILKNSHSKSLFSFDRVFTKEYLSDASKYKRSWKDDEQRYTKHIKPLLGDLRLEEGYQSS